jgi:hypothetical protein
MVDTMSTPIVVVLAVLAGLGTLWVFATGAKAGRNIERDIRRVSRTGLVAGLSVVIGVLVAATQWAVLTHTHPGPAMVVLVLGLPAWLAGITVSRLLALDVTLASVGRRTRRVSPGRSQGRSRGRSRGRPW